MRCLLGMVLAMPACPIAAEAKDPVRPNIVFILVDDLRWDDIACMGHPFVKTPHIDRLAKEGALFRNAFVTTPLCSPSRASFLTGQYPRVHGVKDNTNNDALSHKLVTFLLLLKRAGYSTGFIGKWHMGTDDSPRPGIDHWIGLKGQGLVLDPELNINGKREKTTGYVTDIFNDRAVEFIKRPHDKPFVLYLSHKAVHPSTEQRDDGSLTDPSASHFVPAERHKNLYADAEVPRRPNALIDKLEGKPALMRPIAKLPPLSRATGSSDQVIRDRLRMLMAVEDGVSQIYDALKEKKILDNTLLIFTSDHGYFYGEHGLSVERRLAYEEAIRIPLLMRYPPLIKAGAVIEPFALSVDMAPTLLQLAGASVPKNMHGQSLLPMLKREKIEPRRAFLIEYYSDKVFPRMDKMGYQAVRSQRYTYIQYTDLKDMDELYDLQADPYQTRNLIHAVEMRPVLARMRAEMQKLTKAVGE
jgi:N-acetylglucosamine-6-sulfatase